MGQHRTDDFAAAETPGHYCSWTLSESAPTAASFPAKFLDDLVHRGGVRRFLQRLAKILLMQQLGDIRERMKMLLKLPLRHQEQHHQVNRLIVQRIKIDPLLRPPKRSYHLIDQVRGRMRNPD